MIASISLPNVSSWRVCLNSSTIGRSSSCIFTSISSFSTSLMAWKSGFSTFLPLKAILTSPTRCLRSLFSKMVTPSRFFSLASKARSMSSFKLASSKAEILTTGTPSFFSRTFSSNESPFFSRTSIMLTATTTGTSISRS